MNQLSNTIDQNNSIVPSSQIVGLLVIFTTFIGMFNNVSGILKNIGLIAILILSFCLYSSSLYHVAKRKSISNLVFPIILTGFGFLLISSIGIFMSRDLRFFITLFQFVIVLLLFLVASHMIWTSQRLKWLSLGTIILILVNFALLLVSSKNDFSGIFTNENILAAHLCFATYFLFLYKHETKSLIRFVAFILSIVLIYYTGSRSALIALTLMFLVYSFWKVITKNKFRFVSTFILLISTILAFIFIYPKMIYWSNFATLNNFFWRYTGKNLMSGREVIWLKLTEIINDKLWFGHGAGALPKDVINESLSAHNLFLQVTFQVGIVGLSLLILMLSFVWLILWHGRNDKRVRITAAFFCGILVHQAFEVSLTQNNLSIGIYQWLVLAVGSSFAIQAYRNKEHS